MSLQQQYEAKRRTLDDCLGMICSGDVIAVSGAATEPTKFLNNLQRIIPDLHDVTLVKSKDNDYEYLRDPNTLGHVHTVGHFYHTNFRQGHELGLTSYIPTDLHNYMKLRTEYMPNNVFIAQTTDMDENGNFQIPYCQMFEGEAFACAKTVILEVNPNYRRVRGGLEIPLDRVSAFFVSENPLFTIPRTKPSEMDKKIGGYIADLIHDGDCIQLGLGGMPNAVGYSFFDKKDLGLHTELFTPIMGDLIEAGVITGARKQIDVGKHVGNFVLGDEKLYRILSQDPNVIFSQASYTNDPFVIAKNDNVVSLNTALEIDLTGQVCSESIGARQYSGTGGAFDFAFGAQHSKGGRGILAMASTAKGGTMSKIKPILTPGAAVSISRNLVDIVITEYGVAHLRGRSIRERAEQLIAIAHPDFRDELRFEAKKLLYI